MTATTDSILDTLSEGLDCLESNLSYEDFDHLDLPEDEQARTIAIEEYVKDQKVAIYNASIALKFLRKEIARNPE